MEGKKINIICTINCLLLVLIAVFNFVQTVSAPSVNDTIESQELIIDKIEVVVSESDISSKKNYCKIESVKIVPEVILTKKFPEVFDIPDCDTSFKAYMDYNCITDNTTKQWELQQTAYTDEYGLRKINKDYCVAIGSYYSKTVGERLKIKLDSGNEFTVIISDIKKDEHTDSSNRYTPVYDINGAFYSANVLEFIVDKNRLHSMVKTLGTVSYYEEFKGNITSIEKI